MQTTHYSPYATMAERLVRGNAEIFPVSRTHAYVLDWQIYASTHTWTHVNVKMLFAQSFSSELFSIWIPHHIAEDSLSESVLPKEWDANEKPKLCSTKSAIWLKVDIAENIVEREAKIGFVQNRVSSKRMNEAFSIIDFFFFCFLFCLHQLFRSDPHKLYGVETPKNPIHCNELFCNWFFVIYACLRMLLIIIRVNANAVGWKATKVRKNRFHICWLLPPPPFCQSNDSYTTHALNFCVASFFDCIFRLLCVLTTRLESVHFERIFSQFNPIFCLLSEKCKQNAY